MEHFTMFVAPTADRDFSLAASAKCCTQTQQKQKPNLVQSHGMGGGGGPELTLSPNRYLEYPADSIKSIRSLKDSRTDPISS